MVTCVLSMTSTVAGVVSVTSPSANSNPLGVLSTLIETVAGWISKSILSESTPCPSSIPKSLPANLKTR
jgi:hypothetical protein